MKEFPIDDDVSEPRRYRVEDPNPQFWPPFDHWRMLTPEGSARRYWNSRYSLTITIDQTQKLVPWRCWKMLIIRADQSAHRDYRDFMRIKDEIFGPHYEAIELYPARSREVDPSNAFILYVFAKQLPIGETKRNVKDPAEALAPQRTFPPKPIR